MNPDSVLTTRIITAKHWKPLPPRQLQGGIVHITVNAPVVKARAVASYFATTAIEASAHAIVGGDAEIVQCVPESGEPFAAAGTNATHYHVEIVGMPSMKWAEWLAVPQTRLAARLFAEVFARNKIPTTLIDDPEALLAGERGLSAHLFVTQAVKLAHARKMTSSPFFTREAGHYDPFASPRGPVAGVDQFDLKAFHGMMLEEIEQFCTVAQ